MKLKRTTRILIIVCILGLSLLLYPSFSNYWNEKHATKAINSYLTDIGNIKEEEYKEILTKAVEYNAELAERSNDYVLSAEQKSRYQQLLNVSGSGVMGYVDIPKIGVSLPVYHGTQEKTLQVAIGHLEWSSLPVGGPDTHCVLSGHRGLPNAKLFTNLDRMREGDTFTLSILNEVLTYEVDQIRTVLPNETTDLLIQKDKDYCTLVTCTPYGVNTHRLLVRGHRIETVKESANLVSEAVVVDPLIVAPIVAFPFIFAAFLIVMLKKPKKKIKKELLILEGVSDEK